MAERPQHMLMRVSVGIHGEDIDGAIEVGGVGVAMGVAMCIMGVVLADIQPDV